MSEETDWKEIEPNLFELIEPGKQPQYCVRLPDHDLDTGKQIGFRFVSVGGRKSLDRYLAYFGHPEAAKDE